MTLLFSILITSDHFDLQTFTISSHQTCVFLEIVGIFETHIELLNKTHR